MIKPQPLDKYELIEALAPITLDIVGGRAKIGDPIPGNQEAFVSILSRGRHVTLTTDQYETYRKDVLQWVQDHYVSRPGYIAALSLRTVDNLIRDRLSEVFKNA